jgi:hypothetical protein
MNEEAKQGIPRGDALIGCPHCGGPLREPEAAQFRRRFTGEDFSLFEIIRRLKDEIAELRAGIRPVAGKHNVDTESMNYLQRKTVMQRRELWRLNKVVDGVRSEVRIARGVMYFVRQHIGLNDDNVPVLRASDVEVPEDLRSALVRKGKK